MPPKRSVTITAAWIGIIGVILLVAATLAVPFIENLLNNSPDELEYVGRVIDGASQQTIAGAKVSLDLEGVPPTVYTDSEGIYRFNVAIQSDISGQVRVDSQGYQVYTRNIRLSPDHTTIEDIRLMSQTSSVPVVKTPTLPTFTETSLPPPTEAPVSNEPGPIAILDVEPSSGSWVPASSTSCLWTEASGQGASIVLTLEAERTIEKLRIALFGNFVTKIRLTFSDGSQQTKDLIVIRDYEYQDVDLEPVRTSSMTVEVLEVEDNFFSDFGICHIEVYEAKP